ncbi:hypothetical protein MNBD_ALPHA12-522 [hydrothermal vent metagenome]|uniref:Uncharacterized protein n=1 Tax=hydrothermal vent metagenome TaxID=652676 RepID=A0A3B0TGS0_9ZZZZ
MGAVWLFQFSGFRKLSPYCRELNFLQNGEMWYKWPMSKNIDQVDSTETREWPNGIGTREELDSALEAGLKSGVSERSIDEIFESVIARQKNG